MFSLLRILGTICLLGGFLLAGTGCGGDKAGEEKKADSTAQSLDQAPAEQTSPDMPSDPVDSLSQRQRRRLGPALQRSLTGDSLATGDVKAVGTRDGEKVFSVLIRSDNADALREAGISLTSVVGSTIAARLTRNEILKAASVEDVQSIRTDQEMKPHSSSTPKKPSTPENKTGSETMPNPESPSSVGTSPSESSAPTSGGGPAS